MIARLNSDSSKKLLFPGNPKSAIQNRNTHLEGLKAWRLGSGEAGGKIEIRGQTSEVGGQGNQRTDDRWPIKKQEAGSKEAGARLIN